MPTTTRGLRYPDSSAAPNVPQDIQNLATDVDEKALADTGWVDLTLASGWTRVYAKQRIFRGVTYLSISATRSSWTAGTVLFTLTAAYRPTVDQTMVGMWQGSAYEVHVRASDGVATMAGVGGTSGILTSGNWPVS